MGSETESETESEAETEAKAQADTYTLRITESQNDGLQEQNHRKHVDGGDKA